MSEFKGECLVTMAFPSNSLPDGKRYPTNSATKRDATFGEKIKHLITFGAKKDEKWQNRFTAHPRFAYGHSTCFRDIEFLAKEVYVLSKIQENLTVP